MLLFRALSTYLLQNTPARTLSHLEHYIATLNTHRQLITERYLDAVGYESPIVVLLRKILADAEIDKLLQRATDFDCYMDQLYTTTPDLDAIFDAAETGAGFTELVIARNPKHTQEFLIPAHCQDPLSQLPMDQGWEAWQQVKPLRLVDIDSDELSFQTYQDMIVFRTDYPTRAVFTLDTTALVLQYVNFLRGHDPEVIYQPEYLHRYVLVHLLKDLEDLWLGTVYGRLIGGDPGSGPDPRLDRIRLLGDRYYGYVGAEFPIAMREIATAVRTCARGGLTPAMLLAGLNLSDNYVPDFLRTLLATAMLPEQRQYHWMEYLRDIRWLSLMHSTYALQPNFIASKNLQTTLRRDVPLLLITKPWQNCRSAKLAQWLEVDMTTRLGGMLT